MRSRIWIISLAAGALLAAGTVAPAYAVEGSSPSAPASQTEDNVRGHMAAMHKAPGLVKMHEQMMGHHPAGEASSAVGSECSEA